MAAPPVGERRPHFAAHVTEDNILLDRLSRLVLETTISVSQNGCFENDRVIKSGYVQKRAHKTKNWKTVYLVLRPNAVSVYKNEKETKLRHQIYLSDLSAVAFLRDPKQKRKNVFGLFSSSRNFHFEAPTPQDAQEWVDLIRRDAKLDEDQEEMFLGGPLRRSLSPGSGGWANQLSNFENMLSSSPENVATISPPAPTLFGGGGRRRVSSTLDSSGLSGNEMCSDISDNEGQRIYGASFEYLAVQSPIEPGGGGVVGSLPRQTATPGMRPCTANRTASQASAVNAEQESERVVWQGWVWMLRTKGGVRQWKNMWGVLRARKLILYKDKSEYTAQWIVEVFDVVDVVDIDSVSKNKMHCLQIITEEKSHRFCTHDEESLVQFIGAFKSLLAKRRGLEARAAAAKPLLL